MERDGFLKRLEERLSRISGWLSRQGGDQGARRQEQLEALRRELAVARRRVGETTHADLDRVRAALDDMRRDYEVPLRHTSIHRPELEALRHHLHVTAKLLHDRSDLDSPGWTEANEEYDRSWDELEHAFEGHGTAASP